MIKGWFILDEKLRFIIMAGFNMTLRFLIFVGLGFLYSPEHYQILLAITWFVSSFIAFACYKYFVFSADGKHYAQYIKSLIIWLFSYVVNVFILGLLIDNLKFNPYIAQALAISFLFITNYLLFKHFAFRKQKESLLTKVYDILD